MLVLTRKLGETIVIGDNIVVKVVDIHGKQIRLGIEAPTEITIFRGEIYERIQEENRKSELSSDEKTEGSQEENGQANLGPTST
ncbi:MAG: carbon storage regulator [Calditrichaeota bacterium]|nr:MAG: carbon storage regulator [Calditrichota bacterium]